MTTVTLRMEDGRYTLLTQGHAATPEVCAAVSTLVQTLRAWLHNADTEIEVERIGPGDCELRYRGGSGEAWDMTRIGFLCLEATAPAEIQIADTGGITRA